MRLSNRIKALRDAVSPGESVADIGTDHGYVPMLLFRDGISPKTIMCDISEGSLSKAMETFALCDIPLPVDCFRIGDGLRTLESGEVDTVIIAGLGGNTIVKIMADDQNKTRSFRKFIFQPRKFSGELRYYLYTKGYDIVSEKLVAEGRFICEIITASPADETGREAPYDKKDIRWEYPDIVYESNGELARERIKRKLENIDNKINNMQKSSADQSEKIDGLMRDRKYLSGLYARQTSFK